jgi:hypothetical protein
MKKQRCLIWIALLLGLAIAPFACGGDDDDDDSAEETDDDDSGSDDDAADDDSVDDDDDAADDDDDDDDDDSTVTADVIGVTAVGDPGDYTFAVTLSTADTGCEQYADWWEVLTEAGDLVYRRILAHSHPDEQPFTRDGGPVAVQPDDTLIVRAHMNTTGYGGMAMKGSVNDGFADAPEIGSDFAAGVESQEPQPDDCLF